MKRGKAVREEIKICLSKKSKFRKKKFIQGPPVNRAIWQRRFFYFLCERGKGNDAARWRGRE